MSWNACPDKIMSSYCTTIRARHFSSTDTFTVVLSSTYLCRCSTTSHNVVPVSLYTSCAGVCELRIHIEGLSTLPKTNRYSDGLCEKVIQPYQISGCMVGLRFWCDASASLAPSEPLL